MQAGKYMHNITFLAHFSLLLNCLKTCNLWETLLDIKMLFHFSPQFLFQALVTVINI
jgi:hypothetical protein